MKSRNGIILQLVMIALVAIINAACDSTANIGKPATFIKYIGGHGNQTGVDMVTDADGNIYILGSTTSIDKGQQIYVVKANSDGIVIWEQIYGGAGEEVPKDIDLMNDGNLMIVSDVTEGEGEEEERDFLIQLLNAADGSQVAEGKGGTPDFPDHANGITQTHDGFIVASYTDSLSLKVGRLRRFHTDLVEFGDEWTGDIGQKNFDVVPIKVIEQATDVFYTFGYSNSTINGGGPDYNFFASVNYGGGFPSLSFFLPPGVSPGSNERLTSVARVPASAGGGFILSGYSSLGDSQDLFAVRLVNTLEDFNTSDGIVKQPGAQKISSSLSTVSSASASVFASSSSGFLVLGERNVTGNSDLYLTKVNDFLGELWTNPVGQSFGGVGPDMSGAVAETTDKGILVCGTMVLGDALGQQKIVLIKLNPDGMFGK